MEFVPFPSTECLPSVINLFPNSHRPIVFNRSWAVTPIYGVIYLQLPFSKWNRPYRILPCATYFRYTIGTVQLNGWTGDWGVEAIVDLCFLPLILHCVLSKGGEKGEKKLLIVFDSQSRVLVKRDDIMWTFVFSRRSARVVQLNAPVQAKAKLMKSTALPNLQSKHYYSVPHLKQWQVVPCKFHKWTLSLQRLQALQFKHDSLTVLLKNFNSVVKNITSRHYS